MGLLVVRETPEQARTLAVPGAIRTDLLEAAALVPATPRRIDDPTTVARLRSASTASPASTRPTSRGPGSRRRAARSRSATRATSAPAPRPADLAPYLRPEPFIESDAPEIRGGGAEGRGRRRPPPRQRAERLVRHVHALLEKKPTVSLPSALEVLRTRIGDCNEHTALYVALARALGLPARIAVGLVYLRGAFYYHAWPEVWVDEGRGPRPVAARRPDAQPVPRRRDPRAPRAGRARPPGRDPGPRRPRAARDPRRRAAARGRPRPRGPAPRPTCGPSTCPCPAGTAAGGAAGPLPARSRDDPRRDLVKTFGAFKAVDGVSLEVAPGEIHGFLGPNGAGKTTTIRMIAGLLKPTAGRVVDRRPRPRARARGGQGALGFIPDRPFLYEKLTAAEFLRFHGGLYGIEGDAVEARAARAARALRARRLAGRARRELLPRHEAAPRHVRRLPAPAAGRAGGRADGRPRPARRPAHQGGLPRDEPQRRRHPDEHAHPGGRRGDVRPDQHHPGGPHHRPRHRPRAARPRRHRRRRSSRPSS